jgi:hypothetical protein
VWIEFAQLFGRIHRIEKRLPLVMVTLHKIGKNAILVVAHKIIG